MVLTPKKVEESCEAGGSKGMITLLFCQSCFLDNYGSFSLQSVGLSETIKDAVPLLLIIWN